MYPRVKRVTSKSQGGLGMKNLWKCTAIVAMWAVVGAVVFFKPEASGDLIVGLAIVALFAGGIVAYA